MGQLVCARLWGAVNEIPLYGGVAEGLGGHDITYLRIIPIFFTPIFDTHNRRKSSTNNMVQLVRMNFSHSR